MVRSPDILHARAHTCTSKQPIFALAKEGCAATPAFMAGVLNQVKLPNHSHSTPSDREVSPCTALDSSAIEMPTGRENDHKRRRERGRERAREGDLGRTQINAAETIKVCVSLSLSLSLSLPERRGQEGRTERASERADEWTRGRGRTEPSRNANWRRFITDETAPASEGGRAIRKKFPSYVSFL